MHAPFGFIYVNAMPTNTIAKGPWPIQRRIYLSMTWSLILICRIIFSLITSVSYFINNVIDFSIEHVMKVLDIMADNESTFYRSIEFKYTNLTRPH